MLFVVIVEFYSAGVLQVAEYEITDDLVIKLTLEDRLFYENSCGGLTLSCEEHLCIEIMEYNGLVWFY